MTTRTEPTPQPPIRLTFDGHGFNDAGDPYRRRFATLAPYYTHPDRERGETDALCEFVVRAVNSHDALVEALEDAAVRLEMIAELARKAPPAIGQDIYNNSYAGKVRRALAAAKGTP